MSVVNTNGILDRGMFGNVPDVNLRGGTRKEVLKMRITQDDWGDIFLVIGMELGVLAAFWYLISLSTLMNETSFIELFYEYYGIHYEGYEPTE